MIMMLTVTTVTLILSQAVAKWSQAKAASGANSGDWHDPDFDDDVVDDDVDDDGVYDDVVVVVDDDVFDEW